MVSLISLKWAPVNRKFIDVSRFFGPACRSSGNCQVHGQDPAFSSPHRKPSGFFFGREIVCLNFLKTVLYLTLTQRKWNASSLRRKIRFLSAFFIFLPDSSDPTVKLKVKI
jgi:hypothetical protein